MEFSGPAPLGPFAALAAEMPLRKVYNARKVQPGDKAGDARTNGQQNPEPEARSAEARDIAALRREMERRDLPAGPPPSFQMSLLEVESDIQHVIARVEAARTQAREAEGLKAAGFAGDSAAVSAFASADASANETAPASAVGRPGAPGIGADETPRSRSA